MIVAITTRGHGDTLASLSNGTFGFPVPKFVIDSYDRILCERRVAKATYIFTDLERLAPWELRAAGECYRALTEQGLSCLNDPANAMARVELLRALNSAGINPFNVLRAEERPEPARFPVLLRHEDDHWRPLPNLIESQTELDRALADLRAEGVPLRGTLVVEFCAEPYSDGLWHKWGTFRVGPNISLDHIAVDDNWLVKRGVWAKLTDAAVADEHEAVKANRFADEVRSVFEIGRIEFGRADHALVGGRSVVYEINTNPYIGHYVADPKPLRRATQTIARQRFAAALDAIDTTAKGMVSLRRTRFEMRQRRTWIFGRVPWKLGRTPLKRP
jgi:hypothetical protein